MTDKENKPTYQMASLNVVVGKNLAVFTDDVSRASDSV